MDVSLGPASTGDGDRHLLRNTGRSVFPLTTQSPPALLGSSISHGQLDGRRHTFHATRALSQWSNGLAWQVQCVLCSLQLLGLFCSTWTVGSYPWYGARDEVQTYHVFQRLLFAVPYRTKINEDKVQIMGFCHAPTQSWAVLYISVVFGEAQPWTQYQGW